MYFLYSIEEVSSKEEFDMIKSAISDNKYRGIKNTYETDDSIISGFEGQTERQRIIKNRKQNDYRIDIIKHEILHTIGVLHHNDRVGLMTTTYSNEVGANYIYNSYFLDTLSPLMNNYDYTPDVIKERRKSGKNKGEIEQHYQIKLKPKK